MKPAAHIFDFDGVVVDSISMHLKAWDGAIATTFSQVIDSDLRRSLIGMSTREISELLAKKYGNASQRDALASLKRELLNEIMDNVPFLPGAIEAFALLEKLGSPYGIASNAPLDFINKALAEAGVKVATIVGIENSGRPKPHPDPFLTCAKMLGIDFKSHERCLVFEDSKHGLRAAHSAGMIPIGLETQHDAAYLKSFGARFTCRNLQDAIDRGWMTGI